MPPTIQDRLIQISHIETNAKFTTESAIIPESVKSLLINDLENQKIRVLDVMARDILTCADGRPLADLLQSEDGRFYAIDPVTGHLRFDELDLLQCRDGRLRLWDRGSNTVDPRVLTILFAPEIPAIDMV